MFNENQTTQEWVASMKGRKEAFATIPLEYKKIPIIKFSDSGRFYSNLHHKGFAILLIKNGYVVNSSYLEI